MSKSHLSTKKTKVDLRHVLALTEALLGEEGIQPDDRRDLEANARYLRRALQPAKRSRQPKRRG